MKRATWLTVAAVAMVVSFLYWPAGAFAQLVESEPNDTCEQALGVALGQAAQGVTVAGELYDDGNYEPPNDVDYMMFTGEAGAKLVVRLRGAPSGDGTLGDPFLGLFNSSCELLAMNDDDMSGDGYSLNSAIYFDVPDDGEFVVAATACCDWSFTGDHWAQGTYILSFDAPPPVIDHISGRVIDAITGAPLPWANLNLMRCQDDMCENNIAWANSDDDGYFTFNQTIYGYPIRTGTFVVRAWYWDYEPGEVGPFDVGEGEHYDTGDIGLQPPPVTFGTVTPCDNLPSSGGTCRYSVVVNNNRPGRLQGLAWSNVQAYGTGSVLGYSEFTASREQKTNIKGLSSATLNFSFDVPAGVADGAYICTNAWVSNRENAFLGTIRAQQLFCVQKMWSGYRAVAPEVTEALRGRPHEPGVKENAKRAR